jgi:site-specific recombinase XerD
MANDSPHNGGGLNDLIKVEHGICPFTNTTSYMLYIGDLPLVPAAIFLLHLHVNEELETNTLAAYAYALKAFFTFLVKNNLLFWDIKISTIRQYRRLYLNEKNSDGKFRLKRHTAQQYLTAIRRLIHFWRGLHDDEPLLFDAVSERDGVRRLERKRGVLSHESWQSKIPNRLWKIKIGNKDEHNKPRYKGLQSKDARSIMRYLNKAKRKTEIQRMLYYRNRAIWTFLLMTGLRKGELVRIRLEDLDRSSGIIHLRERTEDAWLGALKTGPGDIYVTAENPYWNHLNSWLIEGRWVAEKMLKVNGQEDHGLLFCNNDGGPLTQHAVNNLFFTLRWNSGVSDPSRVYPHATRHTTATSMLENGVELDQVQIFLRHRSIQSTEIYARVTDIKFRSHMESYWNSMRLAFA